MSNLKIIWKQHSLLWYGLLIYLAISALLFHFYLYKLYPDTISYISIGQKYLNGHFESAVNGFFAPLYSWLLIPFLYIGITPSVSIKVLSVSIGFLAIAAVYILLQPFEISSSGRKTILLTSIPMTIYFAFSYSTPDLLMTAILLFYFYFIFKPDYNTSIKNGVFSGILGGVAYLSKHYAFPFFLAHFILMNFLHALRCQSKTERKSILKNFITGLTAFLILSGTWIGIMSIKYHKLIISTSGKYNYALRSSDSKSHPVGFEGFLKPADESSVSVWDDPTQTTDIFKKPKSLLENFKVQVKSTLKFLEAIHYYCNLFTPLFWAILAAYFLYITPLSLKNRKIYPLVTLFLYSFGLALVVVEERYLWINAFLTLLMGGVVLSKLLQYDFFIGVRKSILIFIFSASLVSYPLIGLVQSVNTDKETYTLAKILKNKYHIHGNIATHNRYKKPLYISFYLGAKFFGAAKDNVDCSQLIREIKANNIDYYFVWDDNDDFSFIRDECSEILNYQEVTEGGVPGLRIFNINEIASR